MAPTAEKLKNPNHQLIDEIARRYYDTATEAAEVLDGSMHTVIPLGYDGHDIHSRKDGTRYGEMMQNSLRVAENLVIDNPSLYFEWRRRKCEAEELPLMIAMASGEGPNTMIVVSDFPLELMNASQDVGGYNVGRKQTMLRVITRRSDGSITLETQTLDSSNRPALEAIYAQFEQTPLPGELLGQRIVCELEESEQDDLCSHLTEVYDYNLKERLGGEWYAGRQLEAGAQRINTYDFVQQQADILLPYINSDLYGSSHIKRGLFQLLKERFEGKNELSDEILECEQVIWPPEVTNQTEIIERLHQAAIRADEQGSVFSACGSTNTSEDSNDYEKAGYGNKAKEELSWHGGKIKKGKCVNCHEGPKDVGVESWCRDCISGHCGK